MASSAWPQLLSFPTATPLTFHFFTGYQTEDLIPVGFTFLSVPQPTTLQSPAIFFPKGQQQDLYPCSITYRVQIADTRCPKLFLS